MTPNRSRHPRGARRATPDRSGNAFRSREPEPAPRTARRPRGPGTERPGCRGRRDHGDPRPPPHRLDRIQRAGDRHVRSGGVDRHARDRALPPERDGAEPADGDDAPRRPPLRHRDPQLADHHGARQVGDGLPRTCAGAGRHRVRERDFEETSDVSELPAKEIISRDAKEYEAPGGQTICIAQVETVGRSLLDRRD
jgi:hypothetical protein